MKQLRMRTIAFGLALLVSGALLAAHPGHEYHVEGVIAKVQGPRFTVKDKDGGITSFMIVPGTEVSRDGSRGLPSDIMAGVLAEVDGVENERGLVEAKKVKLKKTAN